MGTDAEKNPFFLSVVLSDQNNQRVPQYRAILWRKSVSCVCVTFALSSDSHNRLTSSWSDYTVLFWCLKGQYVKTKCLKSLNAQWHGIKCHLPMSNKVSVIKPCVIASSNTGLLSCYAMSHFALYMYNICPSLSGYSKNQPSIQSNKNTISQIYIKVSLSVMHPIRTCEDSVWAK